MIPNLFSSFPRDEKSSITAAVVKIAKGGETVTTGLFRTSLSVQGIFENAAEGY